MPLSMLKHMNMLQRTSCQTRSLETMSILKRSSSRLMKINVHYIELPNNKFAEEFQKLNNAYWVINFLGFIFGNASLTLTARIRISRKQRTITFLLSVARGIIIFLNRFVIKHDDRISQTSFFQHNSRISNVLLPFTTYAFR